MQPIMLDMNYSHSTKNTYVFKSNDENSHVPTIYIKRKAFDDCDRVPGLIKIIVSDTYDECEGTDS